MPSAFVRDSLTEAPKFKAPVVILSYGCPAPPSPLPTHPSPLSSSAAKPPLRLLFAGTLSQSKGLADLLDATEPLGDRVTLTLAGTAPGPLPAALRAPHPQRQLLGQLSQTDLLLEMQRQDLLILPTLYEGLSLVALEALSQGLPVLTTTRSGFQNLVHEGVCQMILLPPGDPGALRSQLESFIEQPDRLHRLAVEGQSWAAQHTWPSYRRALREAVQPLLESGLSA